MLPLVLTDVRASVVLNIALAAWIVLEVRTARRSRLGRGKGGGLDRGSLWGVVLGYALGVFLAFTVAATVRAAVPGPRWVPVVAGAVVVLGGLGLRVWSIRTLGAWFTYEVQVQPGQRVVRIGPYRRLRHPSYAGALLCAVGLGIGLGNWLALLVAVLVPLAGVLWRIRAEEGALSREFGAEHESYRRDTKRLVPGVWRSTARPPRRVRRPLTLTDRLAVGYSRVSARFGRCPSPRSARGRRSSMTPAAAA